MMVPCGKSEHLGQHHTGLPVSQVVGLQTGEDQVRLFRFRGRGQQFCDAERVERIQVFFFDVDGAVGALGQSFADGLRRARRSGAQRDHFAAVLFLQLQRLFQRVRIRLVDLEAQIVLLNPAAVRVDAELRIAHRNLLDGDNYFHELQPNLLKMRHPLVPPNPNEFESAYSIFIGRA